MDRLLCVLLLSVSIGIYAAEIASSSSTKRKSPDTKVDASSAKRAHTSPTEPIVNPSSNLSLSSIPSATDINSLLHLLSGQSASSSLSLSPVAPAININSLLSSLLSPPAQILSALSLLEPLASINVTMQHSHFQTLVILLNQMQQIDKRTETLEKDKEAVRGESETKEYAAKVRIDELRENLEETTKATNIQSELIVKLIQRTIKAETGIATLEQQFKKLTERLSEQEKTKDTITFDDW